MKKTIPCCDMKEPFVHYLAGKKKDWIVHENPKGAYGPGWGCPGAIPPRPL